MEEAGRIFQVLGYYERARNCFWMGGKFRSICLLGQASAAIASSIEYQTARFMDAPQNHEGLTRYLGEIGSYVAEPKHLERMLDDKLWHRVVAELTNVTTRFDHKRLDLPGWRQAYQVLGDLRRVGFAMSAGHLAELAYRARRFADAVELWDQVGSHLKEARYHEAKAEIEPFPAKIKHLRQLERWDEIVRLWEAEDGPSYPEAPRYAAEVVEACRRQGRYDVAVSACRCDPRDEIQISLLSEILEASEGPWNAQVQALLAQVVAAAVREERWSEALELTNRKGIEAFAQRNKVNWKLLSLQLPPDFRAIEEELIRQLASSSELPFASTETQQKVSEHLREVLGRGGKLWEGWRGLVPLIYAGAAIERAGRIIDALDFYERAEESAIEANDRQFARQRLIRCKQKRAALLREREGRGEDADKVEREVSQLRDRWRISESLPDYPEIGEEQRVGKFRRLPAQGRDSWVVGLWKFKWSGNEGRLQIDDNKRDKTAIFFARKQQMAMEAEPIEPIEKDGVLEWIGPTWALRCRLSRRGQSHVLSILNGDEAIDHILLPV